MMYKDPAEETEKLLSALDDMPSWTQGQFISWMWRVKALNNPQEQRKVFATMARRLTKEGMVKFREIWENLPKPDRRSRP
jgi:hypothetical protein